MYIDQSVQEKRADILHNKSVDFWIVYPKKVLIEPSYISLMYVLDQSQVSSSSLNKTKSDMLAALIYVLEKLR